jgi:hypothetical protein
VISNYKFLLEQPGLSDQTRQRVRSILELEPGLQKKRAELLKSDSRFQRIVEEEQEVSFEGKMMPQKIANLDMAAHLVSAAERVIYEAVYSRSSEAGANPCRDFKF